MNLFRTWRILRALLFVSLLAIPALAEDADSEPNQNQGQNGAAHFRFRHDYGQPEIVLGRHANLHAGETASTVLALHGKVNCAGHVLGPVILVDSTAEINGTLDNGLNLIMTKARIGPKAVIHGQLVVYGPEPEISPEAVIDEKGPHFTGTSGPVLGLLRYSTEGLLWGRPFPPGVGWVWWVVLTMFGLTLLVTLMFQRRVVVCANVLRDRPVACFFSGIGFRILTPLGLVLMCCTVILILVVPFVLFLLLAATLLGKAAICVAIGRRCLAGGDDPPPARILLSFVLGAVLIYAVYMVPVLGMLTFLVVSPMVLGAAVLSRFGSSKLKLAPPVDPVSPAPPASKPSPASGPPGFPTPMGAAIPATTPPLPVEGVSGIPATSLAVLQVAAPETGGDPTTPPPPPLPPPPQSPPLTPPPAPTPAPTPSPTAENPTAENPTAGPSSPFDPLRNPFRNRPPAENPTAGPFARGVPPPFASAPPPRAGSERPAFTTKEILACPRASFWLRVAAIILDLIVVNAIVAYVFRDRFFGRGFFDRDEGFLLLWLAYHAGMWVWKGTTLGGSVLGLKCVRTNGEPLDWPVALVRALGSCLSFLACGLGFFWIAWDPEHQSWHDRIADTMIVKMPRAIPLV